MLRFFRQRNNSRNPNNDDISHNNNNNDIIVNPAEDMDASLTEEHKAELKRFQQLLNDANNSRNGTIRAEANYVLASEFYLTGGIGGNIVEVNKPEAVQCFQRAADQGSGKALYRLGNCFQFGQGIPKNTSRGNALWAEAFVKLKQEAQQAPPNNNNKANKKKQTTKVNTNFGETLYLLGVCYFSGDGGAPVDPAQTFRYYHQAADDHAHAQAQYMLARWYRAGGLGVPRDWLLATTYYQKVIAAAKQQQRSHHHCCAEAAQAELDELMEEIAKELSVLTTKMAVANTKGVESRRRAPNLGQAGAAQTSRILSCLVCSLRTCPPLPVEARRRLVAAATLVLVVMRRQLYKKQSRRRLFKKQSRRRRIRHCCSSSEARRQIGLTN